MDAIADYNFNYEQEDIDGNGPQADPVNFFDKAAAEPVDFFKGAEKETVLGKAG